MSTRTATFTEAVFAVVDRIPAGQVASYGDIAAVLGTRAARAVGRAMAASAADVAWWRVIRADGSPPAGHEVAALQQYHREGTPLIEHPGGYRVDIAACRWHPDTRA
ncbi:MAG: MGMT family protein [Microbacteriaceae bacterium]